MGRRVSKKAIKLIFLIQISKNIDILIFFYCFFLQTIVYIYKKTYLCNRNNLRKGKKRKVQEYGMPLPKCIGQNVNPGRSTLRPYNMKF